MFDDKLKKEATIASAIFFLIFSFLDFFISRRINLSHHIGVGILGAFFSSIVFVNYKRRHN